MILVLSDLHLGSKQSLFKKETLDKIIAKYSPTKIICVGDTVDLFTDNSNIKHYNIFPKDTIFLKGNHDSILSMEYLDLIVNNKRFHFLHGHQFAEGGKFGKLATKVNDFLLRVTGINFQDFCRNVCSKEYPEGKFLPSLYKERERLIEFYNEKNCCDVVISGHTHYPEVSQQKNFKYINTGFWDYFLIIDDDGNFSLEQVKGL